MRRLLLILLLLWPVVATAQARGVEGRVVVDAADPAPLQGATIWWSVGSRLQSVLTDERGAFFIPASAPIPQRIAVTNAGFLTQTVLTAAGGAAIEIGLRRTATAAGVVLHVDGMPVVDADVQLQQVAESGAGASWTVRTDDRGEFRTLEIPPGRYRVHTIGRLTLDDAGPVSQAMSDAVIVDLAAGEITRIRLIDRRAPEPPRTLSTGVIAGMVLDADGQPAAGITIRMFRGRKQGGYRYLTPTGVTRQTGADGRYRVFNLPPGNYVVQATDERPFIETLGADLDVPTYHPSAAAAPDAVQLRIATGLELGGIDIRLRREAYVKVSGAMVPTGGPSAQSVTLTRRGAPGAWLEPALTARVTAGAFEFLKVVPGDYVIRTDYQVPERVPFVITAASDLQGIVIRTIPPRTITGRVVLEGEAASRSLFALGFLSAEAESANAMPSVLGIGSIADDWAFAMNTPFGMGRFVLRRAPEGWFVKTIRERSDRPGYEPFDPDDGADITIVVARGTGVIEGTIRGSERPGRERFVIAFSADERLRFEGSPYVEVVTADDLGTFATPPLPPGDYRIVAVDAADVDMVAGELEDPQLLQELARDAVRVSVRDGLRQQVTVSVRQAR